MKFAAVATAVTAILTETGAALARDQAGEM